MKLAIGLTQRWPSEAKSYLPMLWRKLCSASTQQNRVDLRLQRSKTEGDSGQTKAGNLLGYA
ncbi:hypothetical protein [Acaryochloris marina]|uniref:Uncharacterized protein n=1 Tax=Acaryochloris marina (strain MBIC 11017) TaxID=329726 RepID=A8ZLD8_ACAM1|nr:hypothetical protein [Acaryochloris marina]ABW31964.1 hypothetical protein AM1_B0245 [Acaryochloris marina MBIC11017]